MSQGAAIPMRKNQSGGPRVLGGFSLMHESPAQLLGSAINVLDNKQNLGDLFADVGSMLRPELKLPVEMAFRKSLFQRGPGGPREVEEQDPLVGRLLSNVSGREEPVRLPGALEQLVAGSPASRFLSTARRLWDPRKRADWQKDMPSAVPALGLPTWLGLTGLRTTDIKPAAQEKILRELATKQIEDTGIAKHFEDVYLNRKLLSTLDEESQKKALLAQALLKVLDRRAKERSRRKEVEPLGLGSLISNDQPLYGTVP
jgi:hypothetical protein